MNIDWLIPCRYLEVHDNLGSIMGAGIDTFWVQGVPAPIQVAMAVRLTGLQEELEDDVEHEARNIVRGPGGAVVSDLGGMFKVGRHGDTPPDRADWLQGIMLPLIVRFMAESPGTYTFEHIVDASSASVPLHVVLGLPPGAQPPPA